MSKRVTPKQLAANRQNARKSTGPKTAAGRAISKMNALKHGILSKEVLVRGRMLRESSRELTALYERFWHDLKPVGVMEEMLVDQIVTAHWRLRRALTAESGEIALSVDEGQWDRSRAPHPTLQWMQWEVLGDPIPKMEESAFGNQLIEKWVEEVRADVEREGELTEAMIQKVLQGFGGKSNRLIRELEQIREKTRANLEGLDETASREKRKDYTLTLLNLKLRTIRWSREKCEDRESAAENARQAAAVLPSPAVLDKILRYEIKLERQIFRAMSQLERLQRIRGGECIPAPLSVEVSDREQ